MAKHQHFTSQSASPTKDLEARIRSLVSPEKADQIIKECRQIPYGTIKITDTYIILETKSVMVCHSIDASSTIPKEKALEMEEVLGRSKEALKRLKRRVGMQGSLPVDTT